MTNATATKPVLPYPQSLRIKVFKDDGKWDFGPWFMRSHHILDSLYVATITLAHYEGSEEPCYTAAEWAAKADKLTAQYPDCVFIYG